MILYLRRNVVEWRQYYREGEEIKIRRIICSFIICPSNNNRLRKTLSANKRACAATLV